MKKATIVVVMFVTAVLAASCRDEESAHLQQGASRSGLTGQMGPASTVGSGAAVVAPAAVPGVVVAARVVSVSAVVSADPEELVDQVIKAKSGGAYGAHSSSC